MDVAASEFAKDKDAKVYDLDFKNPNSGPSKWVRLSCLGYCSCMQMLFVTVAQRR